MRVFDLRVFLYILYYIHTTINLHTLLFSLKSKTSYLPSVSLLLLCLLLTCCTNCSPAPAFLCACCSHHSLSAQPVQYRGWYSSSHYISFPGAYLRLYFSVFLCISLRSKSHPAQVIIIRTSHDPISQLLHTITAPLRYPLLSTINLPSNNTSLCTVHTTINKITYYYHVFYLKQHTRHSLHIYSVMTCILL